MDYMGYESAFRTSEKLMNQFNDKQYDWLQRILFLSVTLFGILISLHTTTGAALCIRLAFGGALVSLALGVLLLTIALYAHVDTLKRGRKKYTEEAGNAIHERREVGAVFVKPRKIYIACEACAYFFLVLSILLLAAYAIILSV